MVAIPVSKSQKAETDQASTEATTASCNTDPYEQVKHDESVLRMVATPVSKLQKAETDQASTEAVE